MNVAKGRIFVPCGPQRLSFASRRMKAAPTHCMESVLMRMFAIAALVLAATVAGAQNLTPAPAGAEVYIISPKDGAKVSGPVVVRFGLKGMGIAPAGVKFDNTGHHHLLIDTDAPAELGEPLPSHDTRVHLG